MPLVDTPGSVIDRIVREHREREGRPVDADHAGGGRRSFDPASPPGPTHTIIDSATIDGKPLKRLRWDALLIRTIEALKARSYEAQALADALNVNARTDIFEERG